ncbi:MAG: peptidoglycan-binding protein, partial [Actinomycetia bacterium]|nr:peptidoglycan-binding protein [Actinomycetes bacterium]
RALGGIDADGSFGPATERAVVAYQKSKDITGDGVVNANVWNALMGRDYTKTAAGSPAPTPEPAPSTHALEAHASQTLRRGASGAAVTALQRALGGIEVDGSFGPATERAVVAYQRSKGIAPNGIVDASVWNALMGRGGTQGGTAPTPPAPTPEPATPSAHALEAHASQTLRRGASGAAVTALQRALGGIEVDGSFGPATERAVLAYQRANALRGTGVVTADMWNALMGRDYPRVGDEAAAPAPKPTPPAADEPNELDQFAGQTLRRGSRGDAVVVLQTALGDVEVDGSFGPATEARVVAFQRSKDLTANGIVTGEVWTALMNR